MSLSLCLCFWVRSCLLITLIKCLTGLQDCSLMSKSKTPCIMYFVNYDCISPKYISSYLILSATCWTAKKYPVNESVSDIPITDGSPLSAVLLSDGLRRCQSHIRQLFDFQTVLRLQRGDCSNYCCPQGDWGKAQITSSSYWSLILGLQKG